MSGWQENWREQEVLGHRSRQVLSEQLLNLCIVALQCLHLSQTMQTSRERRQ